MELLHHNCPKKLTLATPTLEPYGTMITAGGVYKLYACPSCGVEIHVWTRNQPQEEGTR